MASITIRNLGDDVKERLRAKAEAKGVSMEAEARRIIAEDVRPKSALDAFREAFPADWEGIDHELPSREDNPNREIDWDSVIDAIADDPDKNEKA